MGIGSKLKKLAKKIIPKEVSKAAPIVSIFNPGIGAALGAMGGLREGSIGKAALAGLANYGAGRFAQGLGAPSIGGNLSSGLGSILGNIPGVSQLAASPAGQGVGSFFDKVQAVGGQLGSGLGTASTAPSAAAPGSRMASGEVLESLAKDPLGQQVQSILQSGLSDERKNELITKLVGEGADTGGGGLFPQMSRGQMLRGILGFGLGYFGDKQAEDEYEDMMNRTGFRDTLAQIQAQEASQLPEVKGLKAMANGGTVGFANGGEPAMEMDYRGGGFIPVGAKERADDVPARLSKNEFVMTADAVRAAGGGSVNKGAKKMYSLMNQLEARA